MQIIKIYQRFLIHSIQNNDWKGMNFILVQTARQTASICMYMISEVLRSFEGNGKMRQTSQMIYNEDNEYSVFFCTYVFRIPDPICQLEYYHLSLAYPNTLLSCIRCKILYCHDCFLDGCDDGDDVIDVDDSILRHLHVILLLNEQI